MPDVAGTLDCADDAAEETTGLLEVVSLDLTSLGFDGLDEVALEDLTAELTTETTDDGSLDGACLDSSRELSIETTDAGLIAEEIDAGEIGMLSTEETGAQPVNNANKIRIEIIFFISNLQKAPVTV